MLPIARDRCVHPGRAVKIGVVVIGAEVSQARQAPHWDEPDVVIVGAGASGAAVAWSLAEAGFRVVCLEQGDWVPPTALPHARDDWELHRLTDFNADPNVRSLAADYPVDSTA